MNTLLCWMWFPFVFFLFLLFLPFLCVCVCVCVCVCACFHYFFTLFLNKFLLLDCLWLLLIQKEKKRGKMTDLVFLCVSVIACQTGWVKDKKWVLACTTTTTKTEASWMPALRKKHWPEHTKGTEWTPFNRTQWKQGVHFYQTGFFSCNSQLLFCMIKKRNRDRLTDRQGEREREREASSELCVVWISP